MMEQQLSPSLSSSRGWSVPPGSSITAGTAETVRAANKQSSQKRCTQKIHLHAERRPLWTPELFRRNLEYTALLPGSINAMQRLRVCFSNAGETPSNHSCAPFLWRRTHMLVFVCRLFLGWKCDPACAARLRAEGSGKDLLCFPLNKMAAGVITPHTSARPR